MVLGKQRMYSLAYADDVVLMEDKESGMRLLIGEFEKYMREKDLCVNVEKMKILRFRNRSEGGKDKWKVNGRVVEKVEEFCYLRYWKRCNGGHELNVRRRVERAGKVLGQVWGIGKRKLKNDWRTRVWLFDALVWSVISCGVEISGWREWKNVERMHEKY